MKKFRNLMAWAFILLSALSFASCSKDADVAYTLDGTWKGYLQTQRKYDNRWYQTSTAEVTFNAGYDSGNGYWLDNYSDAPWDYVANHISWRVRNEIIFIDFLDTRESARIRNYHLDDQYFYGEIEFSNSNVWVKFQFVKTSSPNWNGYHWYGSDDWRDSWYRYGAKPSLGSEPQSLGGTEEPVDSIKLIRRPLDE